MRLSRYGRRWYTEELTTDLEVNAWEASFDSGVTWVEGEQVDATDKWRWLLRGPLFDDTGQAEADSIEMSAAVQEPLLRAVAGAEVEVVTGSMILLV